LNLVDVLTVLLFSEYSNLKLAWATMGRGPGGVKRAGRDEATGDIMLVCMETT
jgi:hypothetical protein